MWGSCGLWQPPNPYASHVCQAKSRSIWFNLLFKSKIVFDKVYIQYTVCSILYEKLAVDRYARIIQKMWLIWCNTEKCFLPKKNFLLYNEQFNFYEVQMFKKLKRKKVNRTNRIVSLFIQNIKQKKLIWDNRLCCNYCLLCHLEKGQKSDGSICHI